IDTPIRVAHLGISSVVSIVDDLLLERVREHYSRLFHLPYEKIYRFTEDGRARRTTAYLDMLHEIVRRKMEAVRNLPFFQPNDKTKYFELLPDEHPLKRDYQRMLEMQPGPECEALQADLTKRMVPGEFDVNIMTKIDRLNVDKAGHLLSDEYSDAKASLRGFANSAAAGAVEFSAGLNRGLFNYITRFRDFYRNETGAIKKKIILKVSDFRSALVQGKILAKNGLEVHEFRIESGLNCGGHAFASNGYLLPMLLREFREKRDQLKAEFQPMVMKFYESMGWHYHDDAHKAEPIITVQGGIGINGEDRRMREQFGMDRTGWATPFLLVPEATCVDNATREQLCRATEEDVYLSDASPLGVPFNNLRNTGSEVWTRTKAEKGNPGSGCPKGFLVTNTEFSETPICTAATEYQKQKLAQAASDSCSDTDRKEHVEKVLVKTCLCEHLANSALIALGITQASRAPQAVCPGPNIAWFDRLYSLQEMVDHIYGRRPSLVPAERPHMFAKEIVMYVDYFEKLVHRCTYTQREVSTLREYYENLEQGMNECLSIALSKPYKEENLSSIPPTVKEQRKRLRDIVARFEHEATAIAA
ncbi:MAG: hypothetical protein HY966_06315, partial [Ignavibacteriales bacterium]|nr:hypothetical protein [Ignavibacteriales bacterium]